jgi:hypothetical protein
LAFRTEALNPRRPHGVEGTGLRAQVSVDTTRGCASGWGRWEKNPKRFQDGVGTGDARWTTEFKEVEVRKGLG